MKIMSSFGQTKLLSIKEILTRKNTTNKITSEKLFDLIDQPQNTCPIIDKAKSSISYEIDRAKSCLKDLNYWNSHSCFENECCDNSSNYDHNSKLINDYISNIESIISYLTEINEMMEYLRSDAESLRASGNKIKDGIWSIIVDRETINDVKIELMNYLDKGIDLELEKFDYGTIRDNFKRMDNSYPRLSETFCRNKCDSYIKNNQLVDSFTNIASIDISEPPEIDLAICNKDKIHHWAEELIEYLKNIINDEDCFTYNIEQKQINYLKELNESQFIKYNNFIQNLNLNPIKTLDKTILLKFHKNQDEITLNKAEKDIEKLNDLVCRYNNLQSTCQNLDFSKIEEIFKHLFIEIYSIDLNWNKIFDHIQGTARSIKNEMLKNLENNSPQTYEIY